MKLIEAMEQINKAFDLFNEISDTFTDLMKEFGAKENQPKKRKHIGLCLLVFIIKLAQMKSPLIHLMMQLFETKNNGSYIQVL